MDTEYLLMKPQYIKWKKVNLYIIIGYNEYYK
jgi:hypothetical protein